MPAEAVGLCLPAWDKNTDSYLLITDPLQMKQGYSDLMKIKPDTSKWTII